MDVVAGLRVDHHSIFGIFVTPRFNIRYAPARKTTIRASVGRGQRTANIFADHIGILVSARNIHIEGGAEEAYGLEPEIAWNKGVGIDQKLRLFGRDASIGVDFYRNDFTNQVVLDLENVREARFYNLKGRSFSNSLQAEINSIPVKGLELRMAYRFFDVKTTYSNTLRNKPFTARHRAFANMAYELKGWKMDYTFNFTGQKRIPSTDSNPEKYQLPGHSPSYITMNAQVSKSIGKKKLWDLYIGGENLANFYQQHAILGADDPNGEYFDASMVWGPLSGRLVYAGFRLSVR